MNKPCIILQKELAGALSKYGKLLDKSFTTDVSRACRNIFKSCQEEDLRQDLLNEVCNLLFVFVYAITNVLRICYPSAAVVVIVFATDWNNSTSFPVGSDAV